VSAAKPAKPAKPPKPSKRKAREGRAGSHSWAAVDEVEAACRKCGLRRLRATAGEAVLHLYAEEDGAIWSTFRRGCSVGGYL
jgi:hypothetical protein